MKAFQQWQLRFASSVRSPRRLPPAGVEARRMQLYAELAYANVEGFIARAFPVLREITPAARWHARVRDFYARHRAASPVFQDIPREFLDYLDGARPLPGDFPFLRELAHYEWVELALAVSTAELPPARGGDLLDGIPRLSPLAWPLSYGWEVHRIAPGYLPRQPAASPVHLVAWRNRADEVKFMETNAVTLRLLQLMQGRPATGRALLARIARELKSARPELVIADGAAILEQLAGRDIVLGMQRKRR